MDDLQGRISRFRKDIEHRFGNNKHKADENWADRHGERCQGAIFTFQISTFDKSRFPCALIIAWKSHHSPYPHCISTPLMTYTPRQTRTRTQNMLNSIMIFQSCPKTTTTTSVTRDIKTLGISQSRRSMETSSTLSGSVSSWRTVKSESTR